MFKNAKANFLQLAGTILILLIATGGCQLDKEAGLYSGQALSISETRSDSGDYGVEYAVFYKPWNNDPNWVVLSEGSNGSTAGGYEDNEGVCNMRVGLEGNPPFGIKYGASLANSLLWTWAENNEWVYSDMSKTREIKQIKIELTGSGSQGYHITYRMRGVNNEWGDWASDGEKATGKGLIGRHMKQLQVILESPPAPTPVPTPAPTPTPPYPQCYIPSYITPSEFPFHVGTTYKLEVTGESNEIFTFEYSSNDFKGVYGGNNFVAFTPLRAGELPVTIYKKNKSTNEIICYDLKILTVQ